ncbi:BBE domain-containing protein [Anaerobacterium chartisolvens]
MLKIIYLQSFFHRLEKNSYRLRQINEKYDPLQVFSFPQSIG